MIAKCVRTLPTAEQAARLGKRFRPNEQEFPVKPGRKYLVYGLRYWEGETWIDIESEAGYLVIVPLCLFSIVDARITAHWEARVDDKGNLDLLPAEFHREYFLDDLIEGDAEALKEFWRIKRILQEETTSASRAGPDFDGNQKIKRDG
jgi:hypothetical protein